MLNADGTLQSAAALKDLQWGWQGNNSWTSGNGYCLYSGRTSGSPANGDALRAVQSCDVAAQQPYAAFNPLTGVGAGNASGQTGYLVNFKEYGRCADINGADPTKGLIVYPCKQSPTDPLPAWNQAFWTASVDEPVDPDYTRANIQIKTTNGGNTYCLADPTQTVASVKNTADSSPRVKISTNCTQASTKWTR